MFRVRTIVFLIGLAASVYPLSAQAPAQAPAGAVGRRSGVAGQVTPKGPPRLRLSPLRRPRRGINSRLGTARRRSTTDFLDKGRLPRQRFGTMMRRDFTATLLFLALAARGAGRRFGPLVAGAIVLLAMAHGLFAETLTISRYYG